MTYALVDGSNGPMIGTGTPICVSCQERAGTPLMGDDRMMVFISWSGGASKEAATALGESTRAVFTGVELWIAADDIAPGQQWFTA